MKEFNKEKNPMNTTQGWTLDKRENASERERGKRCAKKSTYIKKLGRHEHRVVAEQMLGRKLREGEVVHHKDGDKHNNKPENLMVFRNQQEHLKYHLEHPEESGAALKRR